jgi:hypothetical protein
LIDQKNIKNCSKVFLRKMYIYEIAHSILMQKSNHAHCKTTVFIKSMYNTTWGTENASHISHDSATQKLAQNPPKHTTHTLEGKCIPFS